ncbi:MAG: complex I subunit 1 family protein, partial [Candidatus Micrarchaeota archaeon]
KPAFIIAPFVSLAAMVTVVLLVPLARVTYWGFSGDAIVLIYALVLASIGIIIGASASGSPFSSVGASREITLMISLKLPVALSILSAAFIAKSFSIGAISGNNTVLLLVGALAYFLCMLGELGRAPFHVSEAETEIVEGIYTEYSGRLLCAYKIAETMRFYALPMLFAALFLPIPDIGTPGMVALQLVFAFLAVVVSALVEAVSARFKIQHVAGFYLKGVLALALIQMVIALVVFGVRR